ncbi:MAG: Flp pilus assembly complex ATPase component TadA [Lachnospiraceae bacterium]|nr:Flp pilus assembly complex ATPase component TadA [Lachnospiraceae bacterium]
MAGEMYRKKKRLGDMLVSENVVTPEQIEQAMEARKTNGGKKLGETLVELGFTSEESITKALTRQLGVEMVSTATMQIPEDIVALVNPNILRKYMVMPFGYAANNMNVLRVAMADPMDMVAIDDLSMVTHLEIEPYIATTHDIMISIDKYFGNAEALDAAEAYAKEREAKKAAGEEENDEDTVADSPIVIMVRNMIESAARQRASDIHVEALETKVRIRYRIDGALFEQITYDIGMLPAIIARLKIMGGMDISEKRKPQDGRISIIVDRVEYDIRVSILPTYYGEKCVMRLAQKTALTRSKKDLGLCDADMKKFDHILSNPHGIILVTGPTGSGKSTTLYTALSELNKEDVNIITVEDPVEANINGINQVHVNVKAGLTFASALRSILRQDPDIIMIGEIRDGETAQIAVQASITGHLVVSTLHTNSSAATIARLLDMGVESYLIADSVVGVIAQRLVRRLCPKCKKARYATEEEKRSMGIRPETPNVVLYDPIGCNSCNRGYKGRIGVYEIMEITPRLKKIISNREDSDVLKQAALEEGMSTLRMSAARTALQGITSYSEMLRVSFET